MRIDVRPLDPVRSIKAKLGLLVVATVAVTTSLLFFGLVVLGWRSRYLLLLAVLIAVAVTQVLAHGMTSPLRQMTAAARAMAEGRPPSPVRTTSRDEVGDLARAFTAMSAEIASADTQRRELLANVAHELRTPVAALRAQLENLIDGVRPADPQALQEALEQTERLGVLVDDLLDLARAEGRPGTLDRRLVPVAELARAVVREVSAAASRDDVPAVTVDVPPDLVADADPDRLRQVLVNLLANAVRHAHAQVWVSGRRRDGGGVVLDVGDDGPGIPAKDRDAVFERFRRVTGPIPIGRAASSPGPPSQDVDGDGAGAGAGDRTRQDGGTGLGLAIAREIVERLGGTLTAQTRPQVAGMRFSLRLQA